MVAETRSRSIYQESAAPAKFRKKKKSAAETVPRTHKDWTSAYGIGREWAGCNRREGVRRLTEMTNGTAPQRSEAQIRALTITVAILTAVMAAGPWLPALRFFSNKTDYLPLHTGLEFIGMAVSLMVFGLGWSLRRQAGNSHNIILAGTLLAVALIDFGHTLSFDGMPDLFGPSGPEKAINFWLIGRAVAAVGLVLVALLPNWTWRPAAYFGWVLGAAVVAILAWWICFLRGDWLPRTFVPGQGLTALKINIEYGLSATYFLAAVLLARRAARDSDENGYWLAAASWVLGLAELFFTLYGQVTDLFNLLGHLYKVAAYGMLYRAVFVAGVVAPQGALKQKEAELDYLAHHDSLTGLANRLLLGKELGRAVQEARRTGRRGALLFLDLDNFKNVNDGLGHGAGDQLLCLVAARLRRRLRHRDVLARMGGDEFVVLLEDIRDAHGAAATAQALIAELADVFVLAGGQDVYIGTSVGICIFPDDGITAGQIIRNADAALFQAKRDGRGGVRFYTESLTDEVNSRVDLESRLRRGIERREFLLHYQPLVSVKHGSITGVEALIRWHPPGSDLIPAGRFISVAEDSGLLIPLGEWGLREACRQMKAWLDQGLCLTTMAVNLSPQQFRRPNIHETVGEILAETGLPARYLELEITEGSLMDPGTDVEDRLHALKRLGVRIAIDDFGTGYSSLSYLKRFPVDTLKIDQSFVRDIPDDRTGVEIAAAVVGLGKALKLDVLAEGIETPAQFASLRELGCDTAQGYLFSRPVPAAEIASLVSGSGAWSQVIERANASLAVPAAPVRRARRPRLKAHET